MPGELLVQECDLVEVVKHHPIIIQCDYPIFVTYKTAELVSTCGKLQYYFVHTRASSIILKKKKDYTHR